MDANRRNQEEYKIMTTNAKCKICRRMGAKLFLKGSRCFSVKCAMIRKPYAPGMKSKKRARQLSQYGLELREKQKFRNWYNLQEKQFRNYVKHILEKKSSDQDAGDLLIRKVEKRLDNVVFRLGFAVSHSQARELVNHRHFLVNKRIIDIPSYEVKQGDKISIRKTSMDKGFFKDIALLLKKHETPSWLKLDVEKIQGEVLKDPSLEEVSSPAEISAIFEYYSK